MTAAVELAPRVGIAAACLALAVARATFYRVRHPAPSMPARRTRAPSPWALSALEQQAIRAVLHAPAYVD